MSNRTGEDAKERVASAKACWREEATDIFLVYLKGYLHLWISEIKFELSNRKTAEVEAKIVQEMPAVPAHVVPEVPPEDAELEP